MSGAGVDGFANQAAAAAAPAITTIAVASCHAGRARFAALEGTNAQMPNVITHTLNGWPFWRDLRAFCTKTGLIPAEFIVDLRFDLLD